MHYNIIYIIRLCISKFALEFIIFCLIFTFVKMLMNKTQYNKHTKYMETTKRNVVKESAESCQLSWEDCPHQKLPCDV